MSVEIKMVETKKDLRSFIDFHHELYKGNKYDAPNLYIDDVNTFRKDKNAAFDFCDAEYYLAYKDGKVVGRVAAIINRKANARWGHDTVRFGWFDFIDDYEVSGALLRTVEQWGKERGMNHLVGPMGFTDTDREGMLIEGFDTLATMYANHNYAYYPKHIEHYGGFAKDNDYVEVLVRVPEKVPEKISKVAKVVEQRFNLHVHKLTRKELMKEGYGREVFSMLNKTYKDLYGFAELNEHKIDQLVEQYINIADLNLVSIIVDGNDNNKMVGFGITFPSLSKAMKKTRNGRLLPFGWARLLDAIYWHHADTVDMLLIGVLPEYRQKGANALIFNDLVNQYIRYGFKWAQAMPQMETNHNVLANWEYFDAQVNKRLRCFAKDI